MRQFLCFALLFCSPALAYTQSCALFVTDGKSLSQIDLSTQTMTKVGDFPSPLATNSLQLSYDWTHHVLYAFDGANFWAIDKDTAQTQGPFRIPKATDSSGHTVSDYFLGTFCYRNDTFYVLGVGSNGYSLVTLNPFGMEVLEVADYPGPFVQQTTCATYDDLNDALLVGGFVVERGNRISMAFRATPLNLTTPATPASFLGNGVGGSVAFFGMSVDPASGDLIVGGTSDGTFSRIKRGTGTIVERYHIADANAIGLAFGEPKTTATQITLTLPAAIVEGDQTQFASVTVTAADGSAPQGKVELTFIAYDRFTQQFTQDLVNGSAKFRLDALPADDYKVQAVYPRLGKYGAISSNVQEIVVKPTSIATQTTLTAPATIVQGDRTVFADVNVTAADGSTPTGPVQLSFSGFGTFTHDLVNGSTQYGLSSLPAGTYQLQANYAMNGSWAASTSTIQTLTVTRPAISTTVTLSAPSSIVQGDTTQVVTVSVTATDGTVPTGTVDLNFSGFGTFTHTLVADGTTSYTLSSLPAGTYTLQANYSAQGGYAGSQSIAQKLQVAPR
jgi:hypothetical protein